MVTSREREQRARSVDIYLTYRCGLSCTHCFLGGHLNSGPELTLSDVQGIVSYLTSTPCREVTLLGGEPMLHPEMMQIIDTVLNAGFECRIVSNGHRAMLRALRLGSLPQGIEICLSIDGPTAEIHDRIRGSGSFVLVRESALRAFADGHRVSGICSISHLNSAGLVDVLGSAYGWGMRRMNVHHVSARGNASSDLVLDGTQWAKVVGTTKVAIMQLPGLEVRIDDPFTAADDGLETYCAVLERENLMFMPDGTVRACMMFIDRPGTNGYAWNASGLTRNLSARSELNQVEAARPLFRCPAVEPGDERFVGGSGGLQVRCIYHKRRLAI